MLGISSGAIVHTIAGSIGISALLLTSAKTFMVVKYLGAFYLFYQAIIMLRDSRKSTITEKRSLNKNSLFKIYKQGAITNILNPKVGLFFLALVPQFISPESSNKPIAYLLLSTIFISIGTIWCLLLALFSSYISKKMRDNDSTTKWLLRVNASVFAYIGYRLATSEFNVEQS